MLGTLFVGVSRKMSDALGKRTRQYILKRSEDAIEFPFFNFTETKRVSQRKIVSDDANPFVIQK